MLYEKHINHEPGAQCMRATKFVGVRSYKHMCYKHDGRGLVMVSARLDVKFLSLQDDSPTGRVQASSSKIAGRRDQESTLLAPRHPRNTPPTHSPTHPLGRAHQALPFAVLETSAGPDAHADEPTADDDRRRGRGDRPSCPHHKLTRSSPASPFFHSRRAPRPTIKY